MFSTWANERNYPPDIIEACLAHQERNAVRAAYNRAEYLDQRRKLLQKWADWLEGLAASPPIEEVAGRAPNYNTVYIKNIIDSKNLDICLTLTILLYCIRRYGVMIGEFKDRLRGLRLALGLSQSDVATAVGVATLTYLRWENGSYEPRLSDLKRLAQVLGVSVGNLAGDEDRIILQRGAMRLELPNTPEGIALAREKLEEFTAGESLPA